jgi:hypothetical protein
MRISNSEAGASASRRMEAPSIGRSMEGSNASPMSLSAYFTRFLRSRWSASFPVSLFRSPMCGKPVVITAVRQTGVLRRNPAGAPLPIATKSVLSTTLKTVELLQPLPYKSAAGEAYQPTRTAYLWCLYFQGEPMNMSLSGERPWLHSARSKRHSEYTLFDEYGVLITMSADLEFWERPGWAEAYRSINDASCGLSRIRRRWRCLTFYIDHSERWQIDD